MIRGDGRVAVECGVWRAHAAVSCDLCALTTTDVQTVHSRAGGSAGQSTGQIAGHIRDPIQHLNTQRSELTSEANTPIGGALEFGEFKVAHLTTEYDSTHVYGVETLT